jgi:hypothetical protein
MANAIPEKLQRLLDELQKDCANQGDYLKGKVQLHWLLSEIAGAPGKFEFSKIKELFDRAEAAAQYANAKNPSGKRQTTAIAKLASDLLSSFERDYRMRHRTRIRRLAHESVAKSHAGSDVGIFVAGLLQYMQYQIQRESAGK